MLQPRHIAVLLIAACLSGCGSYAMFEPDSTASFNSAANSPVKPASWTKSGETTDSGAPRDTSDKANTNALNSLFARAATGKPNADPAEPPAPIKVSTISEPAQPLAAPPAATEKPTAPPRGRAYLFRGVAGLIYSRGMDRLAERINRAGVTASVDTYVVWRGIADQAIRDYRRDPAPITLIGHSMGGDSALAFAETLNASGIPVSLLVTYDPSRIADDVPPNVERYINMFQSHNIMGGGNVVQGPRFHGHYASFNLKDHSEIVHINIEKAERIQEQLVAKIVQLASTPATAEGEAVPLHLEVPAEASIELWDSGLPVAAHAGDTLKTLAETYHVPVWSLAEVNRVSERVALSEGQRIVVPRHLLPMATTNAVSSYAPSGR